jgi:hypothetical protein
MPKSVPDQVKLLLGFDSTTWLCSCWKPLNKVDFTTPQVHTGSAIFSVFLKILKLANIFSCAGIWGQN